MHERERERERRRTVRQQLTVRARTRTAPENSGRFGSARIMDGTKPAMESTAEDTPEEGQDSKGTHAHASLRLHSTRARDSEWSNLDLVLFGSKRSGCAHAGPLFSIRRLGVLRFWFWSGPETGGTRSSHAP